MRIITIVIIGLMLASCSQSRKLAKARETFDENISEAARYCAAKFPVKETTIYIAGDTIRDTIIQPVTAEIPVICPPSPVDTVIRYRVTIGAPVVTKTIVDTLKITIRDSAQIRVLGDSLTVYKLTLSKSLDKLQKAQEKAARQGKTLFWFWLALIVGLLIITRKLWMPILGGLPAMGLKLFSSFLKLFR